MLNASSPCIRFFAGGKSHHTAIGASWAMIDLPVGWLGIRNGCGSGDALQVVPISALYHFLRGSYYFGPVGGGPSGMKVAMQKCSILARVDAMDLPGARYYAPTPAFRVSVWLSIIPSLFIPTLIWQADIAILAERQLPGQSWSADKTTHHQQ